MNLIYGPQGPHSHILMMGGGGGPSDFLGLKFWGREFHSGIMWGERKSICNSFYYDGGFGRSAVRIGKRLLLFVKNNNNIIVVTSIVFI